MFSSRSPARTCILIGQPNTSDITQFETATFSHCPPPKRNTDQRVLNVQFVTVMSRLLPKRAHASSSQTMLQLEILTCSDELKWKPSLLKRTRLWMRTPSMFTYWQRRMRTQW